MSLLNPSNKLRSLPRSNRLLALDRLKLFSIAPVLSFTNLVHGLGEAFVGPEYFKSKVELIEWKAVYVPGWSVKTDCSFRALHAMEEALRASDPDSFFAKVDEEKMQTVVNVKIGNMFFPGTSFDPLSKICLRPSLERLPDYLKRYNPDEHLHQMGMDVSPLPFELSPLSLPELAKHFDGSRRDRVWDYVDKESIKFHKLDATPIYFPFYVANFKFEERIFTLAIEAYEKDIGLTEVYFPPRQEGIERPYPYKPLGRALYSDRNINSKYIQPPSFEHLKLQIAQLPLSSSWSVPGGHVYTDHSFHDTIVSGGGLIEVFERWIDRQDVRDRLLGICQREEDAVERKIEGRFGRIAEWTPVEKPDEEHDD
ncbi:hypothetical protein [Phaffia rhodozyma]|uniref:Uncharacterized protein n=1 Tax=Phaffia rhodozyma TaxID=264483 RepID=A0A0F7SUH0_PHARH|nr:hypothetical protein [Phaffia rhodozyma]